VDVAGHEAPGQDVDALEDPDRTEDDQQNADDRDERFHSFPPSDMACRIPVLL
jgi:hypothetical protein